MLLVRHPFIAIPAKFLGRVVMGAMWGVFLSPFGQDEKLATLAVLALALVALVPFFVGWDRTPLSAARAALYGLLMAGEALAAGSIVIGALAAFSGHSEWVPALVPSMFGAVVLTLYPTAIMYRDNMKNRRDQQQ